MLRELEHVRQSPEEDHRRVFQDDFFDLFIWTNSKEEFSGFQLCYHKLDSEKALSWFDKSGFLHSGIDQGESSCNANRSPIIVADGVFPYSRIVTLFDEKAKEIDQDVVSFVKQKMNEYSKSMK